MAGDSHHLTRRRLVAGGASLTTAGLLAGCTEQGDPESEAPTDDAPTADEPETRADDGSYTVELSPAGAVEFDAVPEQLFTVFPQYADMAVALGRGDDVQSVYVPEMSGITLNHYTHHLDGVSFDWGGLEDPLDGGFSKEAILALDCDVHFADPAWASTQTNWDRSDVEDVATRVAPWFGNFYSGTHDTPPSGYSDYEYYGLWELFGAVADVLDERARYEALAAVHDDLLATIADGLPPEDERPTVVRATLAGDGETFYTYHLNAPGYWLADTRPLGAHDPFADSEWAQGWGTVDFETMLEADPDVFLHLWGLTPNYSMAGTRATLASHPVGSQLTAVQEGRVHPAGMRYQGPIMNLFQLEMGAKQLYPEPFGAWPTYEDGSPYPDIPAEERLFDRDRVAAAIRGEL